DEEIEKLCAMIDGAKRVTLFCGSGTAGAHAEVMEFAERVKAPVGHALRGKEWIQYDNPYDVGMTGLLGYGAAHAGMYGADLLLMLGTDFPYQQFYPEDAAIIQVDIRGSHLGRRTPVDLGMVGSVRDTAAALLPFLSRKDDHTHLDRSLKHYRRTRRSLDELAVDDRGRTPIRPEYVAGVVNRSAADDAVFTFDVGSPTTWAARYLTMNGQRRLTGSFTHGTMACALPHAIGAQTAYPGRQVIALAGDGGLTMLFGELLTLVQNDLPVKVIVFNNSSLNFVELEMKAAGFVTFGTDLDNPDFAAVGDALGVPGWRVEHSADLAKAVTEFLAHDGPAILDVVTERQELSIPPTITVEQAKGFALFAIRTVLSGRGTELIDLARTNMRQIF
ncbi:MAG: thiamine pyrophosphate-dependent enzyme, partial [Actinomycetes bacterium]